jgi:uncharacterized iron-regulated protein
MRIWSFCCIALALVSGCAVSNRPATAPISAENYRVFRGDGLEASWQELIDATKAASVTFLGEVHDDAVAHHLEYSILRDTQTPGLALSLEMFETDTQYVLDEYLAGQITEAHLISDTRAWARYDTDYKPLIELAREQHLPVIAADPPRRYVNIVSREGAQALEALSNQAKSLLPPLPYADASPAYAEKFLDVMGAGQEEDATAAEEQQDTAKAEPAPEATEHAMDRAQLQRALQAQSLWDAGMAHAIASYLDRNPEGRVLHISGSFHSEQHLGTPEHLERYRPGTSTLVVTMVPDSLFPSFDRESLMGLGDFVIVTDPRQRRLREE